jgi:hypothetical protein
MRKLILLALGGAAAAYAIKSRGEQAATAGADAGDYAPSGPAGGTAPAGDAAPTGEAATADTLETEAVVPDVAADDPLVRQQENAAAAEAGSIGGRADSVTADVDPEMRPVVEGSGDAAETFEETEDQGR